MALFQQGMFQINARDTPETIARKRALAAKIMSSPTVAPRSTEDGIGNAFASIMGGIAARNMNSKADAAERAGQESAASAFNPLLDAFRSRIGLDANGFPAAPNPGDSTAMADMPAPDYASARVAQAHGDSGGGFNGDLRSGIIATAEAIGADPLDLATAISYETAGTFDPTKRGPRTQWGQHRGLIQFGEPQARQHGVDWNDPIGSQLGPNGAIASYFRSSGFKPGMSGLDLYSTINAGAPGRYGASDANNGGAPGSVRDKWENQMAGHRRKAAALLGSLPATPAAPEPSNGLTPDALQQWAFANYAPQPVNGAVDAVNALGEAQPVGVAETEADILAQEQAMMGQDPQAFQPSPGTMPRLQAPDAAPPMPPAQFVQERPVQAVQTPQDRGFPEMAGNNPQAIPAPGIDMQLIANVLTNPFSSQEQRAFAQMLLEQEMQSRDPMRQADLAYKQAQIEKLNREAAGGNRRYGLNPIYGQDAQGNTVLGVLGDDGSFKPVDTGGVNISTGVDRVDLGTQWGLLDKRSGQMVGTLPKENYQEAFDTASGANDAKSAAEARSNLPKVEDNATAILGMIESLSTDPYLDSMVGPVSSRLPNISADAARVQSKMDQIGGQAFLQAFETLRGGGQISNVEGERATAALARLNTAQSPQDYRQALEELSTIVRTSLSRARRSAGAGSGNNPPPGASGDGWQDMGGVRIRRKQ